MLRIARPRRQADGTGSGDRANFSVAAQASRRRSSSLKRRRGGCPIISRQWLISKLTYDRCHRSNSTAIFLAKNMEVDMPDERGLPYREEMLEQMTQRRAEAEAHFAANPEPGSGAVIRKMDRLIEKLGGLPRG